MWIELAIVFVISILFIWCLRKYAPQLQLLDIPNERSMHRKVVPRGGGIGIVLAVYIGLFLFHQSLFMTYLWTFFAIALVFLVGVLDDRSNTSPYTKFIVISLSTIMLYANGIVITELGEFFGTDLSLGWFSIPFTVFVVSGFTNALNLIDGIDGLSAIISIIILSVFVLLGIEYHDVFLFTLSSLTITALIAFLLFNCYPASVFMGDSGSLTLGFVISVLAIKSLEYIPAVNILFIAAIPILDTLIVMIRRKRSRRSMFSADFCHLHHILKDLFGGNTRGTVVFLGGMQVVYSAIGLYLGKQADEEIVLIFFVLNIILFYFLLAAIMKKQKRECGKE